MMLSVLRAWRSNARDTLAARLWSKLAGWMCPFFLHLPLIGYGGKGISPLEDSQYKYPQRGHFDKRNSLQSGGDSLPQGTRQYRELELGA